MGIQGLLPCFKHVTKKGHISEYKDKKVAVDAYVWLHRGAYSCSAELCQNKPTDKFITYCMHMVNLLKHHKVIPVLVFDGARLPSKAETESERRTKRKEALEQAQIHLQNHRYEQANECFRKAVDIKPSMAHQLMLQLKKDNVEFVVAPYEADAQMAHMARTGYVACVVTEDSDLIPFGAPRIFYKMDKYGHGKQLCLGDITITPPSKSGLDFTKFTHDMLLRMCILSGCDYLDSLPGVGPKTAHKIIKENKTVPKIMECLRRMGKFKKQESTQEESQNSPSLSLSAGSSSNSSLSQELTLTEEEYRELFIRAELTFRHQRVFDIPTQKLCCLTEPPSCLTEDDILFCGPVKDPDIIVQICNGLIDPMSHKPFIVAGSKTTLALTPLNTNKIQSYFSSTPKAQPSHSLPKSVFKPPLKVLSQEIPAGSSYAATPTRPSTNPSTPSSASTVRKAVTSKFFTPKEATSSGGGNSQPLSSSQPLPSASNSSSCEVSSRKKSLFSTLFSQESSQEALNCDLLAQSSSSAFCINNYNDNLTTAILKTEKLQRQYAQSKKNKEGYVEEVNAEDFSYEEPPSPTLFKTPSRSLSYDAAEETVYHQRKQQQQQTSTSNLLTKKLPLSQPLPPSSSDSSLKKRKSSFVDKFIRKTPSSSQKSDLSQGLSSSQSSNASSSSTEHPQPSSQPLSQPTQTTLASSKSLKNLFFYDLSSDEDLEPANKKVKQHQLAVTVVDSSEEDEELVELNYSVRAQSYSSTTASTDMSSEKNVFELFLSNDKDD
ncbi:hypothetical protein C9374_004152 [Naegleria lovaniensis]|uniref:Exonuclease 1 n=1 Tax=Naegleria lovaniensis TaxID=51637 RepID=A0AA88KP99_NAELO|nr:uncharacterized protein C9374_004152 [Naegleria lovaniensis]KAG2383481.1 hypothetical protein C9374_004152 [Naegleria lovaniensis]